LKSATSFEAPNLVENMNFGSQEFEVETTVRNLSQLFHLQTQPNQYSAESSSKVLFLTQTTANPRYYQT
jgi:hypothetical protein